LVRGCEFREDKPQLALGDKVRCAVVSDNIVRGRLRIDNQSSANVVITNNAGD